MPELPEVQTIIDDLKKASLIGSYIKSARVYWPKTVACLSATDFCQLLTGRQILNLDRRGKYIILTLSGGYFLCIHLRMTGRLLLVTKDTVESAYIRLRLDLDQDRSIYYHDTRKFGRWYLVQDPQLIVGNIGPEPLSTEFSFDVFWKLIQNRSRALKPLLLDQTVLAGLGNIYVDEALWEAYLHPLQQARLLKVNQAQKLHQAIIYVLQRGIDTQGTTLGKGKTNYYRLDGTRGTHQHHLNVFRRTGEACFRCGHLIERLIVAQRSSHICPHCQKLLSSF